MYNTYKIEKKFFYKADIVNHFHWETIIRTIQKKGKISVSEVASLCSITLPTARKYLMLMHEEKLLLFSRGKAERMPQNYATVLGWRSLDAKDEKKAIGRAAAALIQDGETIFLGGGSTVMCILDFLEYKKKLTVISNSIYVINKVVLMPHVRLIGVGGDWNPETNTFAGNVSHILQGLFPHRAFFGVVAIDPCRGIMQGVPISHQDELLMAACARDSYILADHSKFKLYYPWVGLPPNEIKNLITDKNFSPAELKQWEENGTNIIPVEL